ncbi:MAG: cysteine synthase [Patescibacteria group bacterium]|jgi:cysteine synthase
MIYQNILATIGNTPLVKINKLNKNKKVNIYIKLEGQNPGGSIKDRIAIAMVEAAEKTGELTKDKTIIEATSGNTGIGLAMVAAFKGYRATFIMSEAMSEERKKIIESFGAKIIFTSKNGGTDGAIVKAQEILKAEPEKYWMPNQFVNMENPKAHYQTTAEEILRDMPTITHFIVGIGTSGTMTGVARRLREYNPKIKIIAVEPLPGHKVQGLKNMKEAIVPKIYNPKNYDEKISVEDQVVYKTVKKMVKKEGIFVGMSSGAAIYVALKMAEKLKFGDLVAIAPDRGDKYISTNLFN